MSAPVLVPAETADVEALRHLASMVSLALPEAPARPGPTLEAPFPWFGGKRRVAPTVWRAFGDVRNYVEPFAGSLAVLLQRPTRLHGPETVNDKDGLLANFWRAVQADPDRVAQFADWPLNEADKHARHVWLVGRRPLLLERLEADPTYFDARLAGWWVWGLGAWIGGGWCSGRGPWGVADDGRLVRDGMAAGAGINRQLPNLGSSGQGVHRLTARGDRLVEWFRALSARLRYVRVACGDWTRVTGPSVTFKHGLTGVFLDPPYLTHDRSEVYAEESDVAADVYAWAIEAGRHERLRVAFCAYDGHFPEPEGWTVHHWSAVGGYGSQGQGRGRLNARREVIYFSPACLPMEGA